MELMVILINHLFPFYWNFPFNFVNPIKPDRYYIFQINSIILRPDPPSLPLFPFLGQTLSLHLLALWLLQTLFSLIPFLHLLLVLLMEAPGSNIIVECFPSFLLGTLAGDIPLTCFFSSFSARGCTLGVFTLVPRGFLSAGSLDPIYSLELTIFQ